ncbi:MFS transporter [Caloramator proteoclasticus]|uniref:MFS transporter, UMF1 family n=1 Tax=Caloramator proteoclasticus DSM 10124 TaxID=1121262 RepID=A0A1M4VJB3_9CLOT|nr:MFS transporter [Caloramator proteoclasticus]SHE68965.1 MFS transporter, UMF1 family [Caloramator proteoclasticus DSM 10124]
MNLNKEEKSWAMYDWANSAYSMTVTTTILPLYFKMLTDAANINKATSTAYWGYANSIATLVVALLAPILGTIADYKGYKKKFFVTFFLIGIISTSLLAIPTKNAWFILLVIYLLTVVGFSGANIFYDAFLVDVTSEDRMDRVSTMGYALGYIGSTIPFIICMIIVILAQFNKIPMSVYTASKISFIITAIWWGIFTIPMIKNVNQKYFIEPEKNPISASFRRIINTFKDIKKHKPLFIFLLAYFFYIDGVDTIIKMSTSYGADLGISATSLLIILLLTQFVAFPFAILYGRLSEKYSTKTMLYVAIAVYTGICIYAYFLKTAVDFWILAMLVGTSQGGIQALSRSYFGKLVPKESSNEFFGFYNIFGKFAAIMGPFLVGLVAQLTGKTNNGVFSVIILFIIGGILLKKVPN